MQALDGACLVCRSEISVEDAFCQECGSEQKRPVDQAPAIAISTYSPGVASVATMAADLQKRTFKPAVAASIGFCLAVGLVVSIFYVTEKWAPSQPMPAEEPDESAHRLPQYTLAAPASKPVKEEQKRPSQPAKLAALPQVKEEAVPKQVPATQADSSVLRSEKPDSSYTEGEMVKYNELLTSYFTRANASTAGGAKAEPPTFDEWVAQGRPDF